MFILFTNVLIGVMTYFPISVVSSIKGQAPAMANAVSFLAKKDWFWLKHAAKQKFHSVKISLGASP